MKRLTLDWTDSIEVRLWLLDLGRAVDDLGAVAKDQGRVLRKRRLGPVEARRLYREARGKLADLLAYALPETPEDGGSGGDPAGSVEPRE